MSITITDNGLKAMLKRNMNAKGLKLGLAVAALDIANELKVTPTGNAHRAQSQYWTPEQRRGFFYHLKKGDIEVPYRRGLSRKSQKLSQSWVTEARDSGLTQVVGTSVTYAPKVQSAAKQTQYHKITGWRTEQAVMRDQEPKAMRTIGYYIEKEL